jgi:hypothetical protein
VIWSSSKKRDDDSFAFGGVSEKLFWDSFNGVSVINFFQSVPLFVGLGLLSWVGSLSAHDVSAKINAKSLLREYFQNEVLPYSSQVENRCGRIGLNPEAVNQILNEEIQKAELLPVEGSMDTSHHRIVLVSEVRCLSQYLGSAVTYHYKVSLYWEDGEGPSGRLTLGPVVSALGFGDEVRKPLNAIRMAARKKTPRPDLCTAANGQVKPSFVGSKWSCVLDWGLRRTGQSRPSDHLRIRCW